MRGKLKFLEITDGKEVHSSERIRSEQKFKQALHDFRPEIEALHVEKLKSV